MLVGFIGSRSLPVSFAPLVASMVSSFLASGHRIASGGAAGADQYALSALLQHRAADRGVIYSAWSSVSSFPASVRPSIQQFILSGDQVIWGQASAGSPRQSAVSALLGRNRRLVSSCSVIVAFLYGQSRGTCYTIRQAVQRGIQVIVFHCDSISLKKEVI
ncbi:DNA-processing protein DprA [Candidatus Margulisiibacteriota bacterium]